MLDLTFQSTYVLKPKIKTRFCISMTTVVNFQAYEKLAQKLDQIRQNRMILFMDSPFLLILAGDAGILKDQFISYLKLNLFPPRLDLDNEDFM